MGKGWGKGTGNTGKGSGGKGAGMGSAAPVQGDPKCYCCGKTNHVKAECRYRMKNCNRCGVMGHLEAACRLTVGGASPAGSARTGVQGGNPKSGLKDGLKEVRTGEHWTCHKCYGEHPDMTLHKCPIATCKTKRIQDEEAIKDKDLIGKEARKILEEGQVAGDTAEATKWKEELVNVEAAIKQKQS